MSDPFLVRYWQVKKKCPKCEYQWSDDISSTMFNLRKVDTIEQPIKIRQCIVLD